MTIQMKGVRPGMRLSASLEHKGPPRSRRWQHFQQQPCRWPWSRWALEVCGFNPACSAYSTATATSYNESGPSN